MVHFSDDLYCTDHIAPEINRIKLKMYSGIGTIRVYFITFSSNDRDVFDIYPASLLKQRPFRRRNHYILGLAESKKAAIKLTGDMIVQCINETGSANNIRGYFEDKVKW